MADYVQGSQADSDKDWYRGELTKAQAEEALRDCGSSNCFLVRESTGSLILSLRYHDKQIKHIKIERGPGWYQLEHHVQSSEKRFSDLNELVSYHRSNAIDLSNDLVHLGVACKSLEHEYAEIEDVQDGVDSESSFADLDKHDWYHGKTTEEYAMELLSQETEKSCFLVRKSGKDLVLSMKIKGLISHVVIDFTSGGYHLHYQKKEEVFKTIPEMMDFYDLKFSVKRQRLETAKSRQVSNIHVHSSLHNVDVGTGSSTSNFPWYLGKKSRSDAEAALRRLKDGVFLVRESYDRPGEYAIALKFNKQPKHVRIFKNADTKKFYLHDEDPEFVTIEKLVAHYQRNSLGPLFSDLDTALRYPYHDVIERSTTIHPSHILMSKGRGITEYWGSRNTSL